MVRLTNLAELETEWLRRSSDRGMSEIGTKETKSAFLLGTQAVSEIKDQKLQVRKIIEMVPLTKKWHQVI